MFDLKTFRSHNRFSHSLVIVDHNNEKLSSLTLNTITAAKKMGPNISCLVIGHKVKDVVNTLTKVNGINKILVAENEIFKGFLPEVLTQLVVATHKQFNFSHIISGASAVGKVDIIFDIIFINNFNIKKFIFFIRI